MAGNFNTRKQSASSLILLFTIAVHFLTFYCWRWMVTRPLSGTEGPSDLAVKLIILRPDAQHQSETRPVSSNDGRKPSSIKIKRNAMAPVAPQAITTTLEPSAPPTDLNIVPPPPDAARMTTDQMIANAKRDVGKIDRDLRKATPKFPEPAPNSVQARLEKNIAAAGKHAWGDSQEKILSDGRKITKYYGLGGAYCVTTEGAGSTNGLDQIQGGAHSKVTNCGSLFD